jgi:hypothetical protein
MIVFFLLCDASDHVLNAIDTLPTTAHYTTQIANGVMAFRVCYEKNSCLFILH